MGEVNMQKQLSWCQTLIITVKLPPNVEPMLVPLIMSEERNREVTELRSICGAPKIKKNTRDYELIFEYSGAAIYIPHYNLFCIRKQHFVFPNAQTQVVCCEVREVKK